MALKLRITKTLPIGATHPYYQQYSWLDLSIIVLALASLFFTWKYIYEVAVLYDELKLKYAAGGAKSSGGYKD